MTSPPTSMQGLVQSSITAMQYANYNSFRNIDTRTTLFAQLVEQSAVREVVGLQPGHTKVMGEVVWK